MFRTYVEVCATGFKNKSIHRHPICLIDADYDYILDGIDCQDKIEFERTVSVNSAKE